MRCSTVLAALGAVLAVASPIHQGLHARMIVTDIITDIVWVTVTEGAIPTPTHTPDIKTVTIHSTVVVQPIEATTSSTPPPPPPTTSTEPAPAPTTESQAPVAPAPTTTQEAVVQASAPVSAAPVASPTDYISAVVDSHNIHRQNHSAPDISWSDSLAASSLVVAQSCVFAHDM